MKELSELVLAIATILWPIIFVSLLWYLRREIRSILANAGDFSFEVFGGKLRLKPSTPPRGENPSPLPPPSRDESLPFDYIYLNHTSFLRSEKQEEFRRRTGVALPHYDIRVVLDSYYSDALQQVERVEYVLDQTFPNPIQVRFDSRDRFLLKEIANGEFIIQARVLFRGKRLPVLLQRYITLWKEGPRLDSKASDAEGRTQEVGPQPL